MRTLPGLALAALAGLTVWWGCRSKEEAMRSTARPIPPPSTASKMPVETATFALG